MLGRVEKRRDVDARFYKPTCLIAVVDGIADGSLAPSDLEPDRVVARFGHYLGGLFPERATLGWRPFWHLSRDGAWSFSKEGRSVGPEDFGRQRKPNSRRELISKIDCVAVPPEDRPYWRSSADRAELRAAIIAMLWRDNEDCRLVAERLDADSGRGLSDVIELELAAERPAARGASGQGFRQSSAARRAVELRAMKVATSMLELDGWTVTDVSARRSYDLHCVRSADIRFVEVKGTTGAGEAILLTSAEVAFASLNRSEMMLVVVTGIRLAQNGDEPQATGGTPRSVCCWAPEPGDLSPISYSCRTPFSNLD